MAAVLGIDAAWTAVGSSAVALLHKQQDGWFCRALAPSYETFNRLSDGSAVDWTQQSPGSAPNVPHLLQTVQQLLHGQRLDVVAVDMPLAHTSFVGRRCADDAIARAFGGRGCSTHSPSADRPGQLSRVLHDGFAMHQLPLATTTTPAGTRNQLLEVYPHPALLALLDAPYRIPYKVGHIRRYWPHKTPAERRAQVIHQLNRILTALHRQIQGIPLELPGSGQGASLRELKAYEDAVDALVCAWVAAQYLEGNAMPYGDADAAIWVPAPDDSYGHD